MKVTEKYIFFLKNYLSQWNKADMIDTTSGIQYNCCEQYMMHRKAVLFEDYETAKLIMLAEHPGDQKALGRKVKNFNEGAWNQVREKVVYNGNFYKFTQNPELKKKLLNTKGKLLVEASPEDRIWGIGMSEEDSNIEDTSLWGLNLLGKILTQIREELIVMNAENR